MALGGVPSTPFEAGISAEAVWDVLEPRHVGIRLGDPQVATEAVLIHENVEQAVLFLPAGLAQGDAQIWDVPTQGDDGGDGTELTRGFYHVVPGADYVLSDVPDGSAALFSPDGAAPSLAGVAVNVPFVLLPEDVVDQITNLPFADAEEPEELFSSLVREDAASLLFGPGVHSRLVAPSGVPPQQPQPQPVRAGSSSDGGGAVLGGAPPAAGRGRALPGAAVGGGPGPTAGRGRGRGAGASGSTRAAAAPRLSLAALSAQISEGFAAVRQQGESFEARLTALEGGGGRAQGISPDVELRLHALEGRTAQPPPALAPPPGGAAQQHQRGAGGAALVGELPAPGRSGAPPIGAPPLGLRVPAMPPAQRAPPQQAAPILPGRSAGIDPAGGAAPGARRVGSALHASLPLPPGLARQAAPPPAGGTTSSHAHEIMAQAMADQARAMAAMMSMQQSDGMGGFLEEPAGGGAANLRGARGAAALLKWRQIFGERPQLISSRIRQARNRAMTGLACTPDVVPSMRNYFATEVPFGHAKTAAYLVFGLADIADLLEAGRWHEGEALVNLLLSAAEQAALQEWQWGMAWLLTFSAEPPWARIRNPAPAASDLRSVGRLADPELLAAAVGHMKDFMAISEAQRKAAPTRTPGDDGDAAGAGKGGGKGGKAKAAAKAAAAAAEAKKQQAAAGAPAPQ